MKRVLLACAALLMLETAAFPPPAKAALPVIDIDGLVQAFKQLQELQQMQQTVTQQLRTLQNVPRQMIGQFQGLLDLGVSNPLQDITSNLESLMHGSGTGRCTGSQGLMALNQYAEAAPMAGSTEIDFNGAQLNGSAARGAGLLACTQQMMQATQSRLQQMPGLLGALESCADITCETGISGRIQYEQAMIQTQMLQTQLVGQHAQQQRWTMEDQTLQKQRADSQAWIEQTGGAGALGTGGSGGTSPMMSSTAAPMFSAR